MEKQNKMQRRAIKKLYALGEKRPIDLSLSENPLGCSSKVFCGMKNLRVNFNDYPTPNGFLLKKALAETFRMNEDHFFIANGSESIICDIPRVFACTGDEVLIPQLTFPMFQICSELAGLKPILAPMTNSLGIDLEVMKGLLTEKTRLVFICNPNNPTGNILSKKTMLTFLDSLPKSVILVVDEANIEFGGKSIISEIRRRENLIVLRTFSKGFGLANLRIGFAVSNAKITQKLEEETPVFQISGLSEKLAIVALGDNEFLNTTKKFVRKQRLMLKKALTEIDFTVFPSSANNLFIKLPDLVDLNTFKRSLETLGISLVMGSNFEGFSDQFLRISVRTAQTNRAFIEAMRKVVRIPKV